MKSLELRQGSAEWHAHRAAHFNASDAPAMLDCSPYKTRNQLLHEKKTGLVPESDERQQRIYDAGHEFEALARPLAEDIVGEDLYPVVGTHGMLSASFDGLTMDQSTAFEHKTLNDQLRGALFSDEGADALPKHYRVQMEQQCMVSGAGRVLFMASVWHEGLLKEQMHVWYEPDAELRAEILAGWRQFSLDLDSYTPVEPKAEAVGRTPETLPALRIEVTGAVTASNLAQYRDHALAVFAGINRELKTDQDFANADKTVKWCADVESRLAAAKQHALSQTESIDALFKTIDDITAEARSTRLELDKLVKARKEARRGEIVAGGVKALADHVAALNVRIGKPYMPATGADFGVAIKGLRTFDSMQNAVDTALANAKIAANATADRIDANLKHLSAEAGEHLALFPDVAVLVLKQTDDFAAVVQFRVADQRAKEQKRAADLAEKERERIRQEEQTKAEAAAKAQREAEAAAAKPVPAVAAPAPTPAPVATPVAAAPSVIAMPQRAAPAPVAPTTPPALSLGRIKERIAPIEITAAGLATLGFTGLKERGSVLFHEEEFEAICEAIERHVAAARASYALEAA